MRYQDPAEVYLRKLEEARAERARHPAALSRPIVVSRPPEMALVVLGVLAALAALGGILYVLLW